MIRATLLAACLLSAPVMAADLVVVIDDLGYSRARAERVLALPAPVTLAVLPFAPATPEIANLAIATGHELILHQPMEPLPLSPGRAAVGTLTETMSPARFDAQIDAALRAVPGIVGVNNHTGSLLTQDPVAMRRLMQRLASRGLFFLDSRTTPATVAYSMARESHVPALQRDVFLDHVARIDAIRTQFARAVTIARRRGYAVMIAHPYDVSLSFLATALSGLPDDVSLTSLERLVNRDRPVTFAQQQSPGFPHRSLGQ